MDEIANRWKALGDELQEKEKSVTEGFNRDRSELLLARLNRNMKLGLMWNIAIMLLPIVVGIYHRQSPDMLWLLGGYFLILLVNLLCCGSHYLKVRRGALAQESSVGMLERYLKAVKRSLLFEKVWSLFTIPLSLLLAILYAQLLRYGSFAEIRPDRPVLIVTALLMVTAVPVVILWIGWLQRKAYGDEIKALQEMIAMLSSPG